MTLQFRWTAVAAVLAMGASFGVASAEELKEQLGSDGMETGAMEISGIQTQEAEASARTFGDDYYGTEPIKFLSNNGEGYSIASEVLGPEPFLEFGGWVQLGYTSRSTGLFNSDPSRVNLQQTWLYVEKPADGSDGLDWGFRFDAMYGTDAGDTQAFGNRPGNWDYENGFDRGSGYGWALPQLYAELAYEDFSLIGGHFYTLLGYEVVTAPDNFFYSHAFTMYLSEAFTHTGVLLSYSGLDMVEFYGGWTAGWDTGFDQNGGGSNFLGGFSVTPIDEVSLTYIATAGNLGAIGDGYSHSIVIDYAPEFAEGLNYVLQSDYLDVNEDVLGSGNAGYSTIGINQYLMYWVFEELGVGTRFEWWKANGVSYFESTTGLNLKPLPNMIIRPEIRWQWGPADYNPSDPQAYHNVAGLPVDEGLIFGMDIIFTF